MTEHRTPYNDFADFLAALGRAEYAVSNTDQSDEDIDSPNLDLVSGIYKGMIGVSVADNTHLSDTARNVYEFICRHKAAHDGNSPNLREIAIGAGLATTSTATVREHLRALANAGLIRLPEKGVARGIEVVGGKWTIPERRHTPAAVTQRPPLMLNGQGGGVYSVGVVE